MSQQAGGELIKLTDKARDGGEKSGRGCCAGTNLGDWWREIQSNEWLKLIPGVETRDDKEEDVAGGIL